MMYSSRGSASYVTGSHAFKTGFTLQEGHRAPRTDVNSDVSVSSLNGVPSSLTEWTTPYIEHEYLTDLGLYAQDKWTFKRLTLNAGLRLDHHSEGVPGQSLPATQFVGARNFPAISDVPKWNDLDPRLGLAYDLFGNGKTALKATWSRYVNGETIGIAAANNPVITSVNNATRTWNDISGTFNPFLDCNLANPAANGGCGPLSNNSFGKQVVTTTYDPALLHGWFKRPDNYETSVSVTHQLAPQLSVDAAYFHRSYGNFEVTKNLDVNAANYDPYCVPAPQNPGLPGGGGYTVCGLYDLTPSKVGQVQNLVTFASNYGNEREYWDGVDLSVRARFAQGGQLNGGVSVGREVFDNCDVTRQVNNPAVSASTSSNVTTLASPNTTTCHQAFPFLPQIKLNGVIALPWNLRGSGTYQGLPGPLITAQYVATNAVIRPSLGRNLSAGPNATAMVELIQPGTMYAGRLNQIDLRLTRTFQVGRVRLNGNLDCYNALNSSAILILNTRYGPAWLQPTYILPGRLVKFGATFDF
jgi:hypothetical protein